jgi:hypothetical protein
VRVKINCRKRERQVLNHVVVSEKEERAMKRQWAVTLLSAGLLVLFGSWTVAIADDDDDRKSDFALFDGTNPATEAPPDGGAECTVKGAATFYVAVTNHASGNDGFVRATFADGDFVEFPIKRDTSFSFSQSIGGTKDVDTRIRISNGGRPDTARLVGWVSALGKKVSCRSCNFNDGAGGDGCQNSP